MDIKRTDVERAAIPAEGPLGIELQVGLRQPVIDEALLDAAGHVPEDFTGLDNIQRHPRVAQQRTDAAHVAQQQAGAAERGTEAADRIARPPPAPRFLVVSSPDSAGVDAAVEGGVARAGAAVKQAAITPAWKACVIARRFESLRW